MSMKMKYSVNQYQQLYDYFNDNSYIYIDDYVEHRNIFISNTVFFCTEVYIYIFTLSQTTIFSS